MSTINDKKILDLKNQILQKKNNLENVKKFVPVTNCSIEIDGQRLNIQTLPKETLILLMIKINSYLMSAKDLGLTNEFTINGYTLKEWLEDLTSRLNILSKKDEERKLKAMEDKLDKLLSDDKKTELELQEIETLLK